MPKITYTDEVDARFGIPWTNDLKYDKGELVCALSEEEIDRLTIEDPERAETLTRLLMDQPGRIPANAFFRPCDFSFLFIKPVKY